jgi:hypothetical protein
MLRRFGTGKLRPQDSNDEDVNPLDGIANMADLMLVLAVGIMVALVMNWNVNISSVNDLEELNNAEYLNGDQVKQETGSEGLEKKGVVYMDPETGKYYIEVDKND